MGESKSGGEEKGGKGAGTRGGFRVPGIVVVPLLIGVCWFVAGWLGGILGGVVGVFLWRSRS